MLDHSDDAWVSSPGVGGTAFSRRVKQAGLLTAAEETTLARHIDAGAFASSCAAPSAVASSTSSAPPTKPASR